VPEAEVLATEMGVLALPLVVVAALLPLLVVAELAAVLPPDAVVVAAEPAEAGAEAEDEVLKGIGIPVSPDDPLDVAPEVVAIDPLVDPAEVEGAEEAVVPPDAAVVDEADVVSIAKVAVIIVIFTVMTVSLHQPIQNM